jgi:hypothetical protein
MVWVSPGTIHLHLRVAGIKWLSVCTILSHAVLMFKEQVGLRLYFVWIYGEVL